MAWIVSHQELARHPKTRRLGRLLNINARETIGLLHLLWWWALDYAEDGDLSRYENADIADAVLWDDDANDLVQSLVTAGFVDSDRRIHDWWDYAGRLVQQRKENAERMRSKRATHVQDTYSARTGATQQNTTEHNMTEQNPTQPEQTNVISISNVESPPILKNSAELTEVAPIGAASASFELEKPEPVDLKPKEPANENAPPELSENELYYASRYPGPKGHPKRLTLFQRKLITDLVAETGENAYQKAVDWAAANNRPDLNAIATVAKRIKREGRDNGNGHRPKETIRTGYNRPREEIERHFVQHGTIPPGCGWRIEISASGDPVLAPG